MSKKRIFIALTILLIWIAFIFGHSLVPGQRSSQESQWVLQLLSRILPFELTSLFVRKAAHFIEFSILGGLSAFFLIRRYKKWWKAVAVTVAIGLFIALSDETIQLFVDGRAGLLQDVWLDSAGVLCGALVVTLLYLLWQKWKTHRSSPVK